MEEATPVRSKNDDDLPVAFEIEPQIDERAGKKPNKRGFRNRLVKIDAGVRSRDDRKHNHRILRQQKSSN